MSSTSFDYVVIGSGASGSVVAHRLSADPTLRVLVLEAGGLATSPDISDPGGFVKLWGTDQDWKLLTEPQPGMADRQLMINQGKVLGGSTSLNAMMYVRGNRRNFDEWDALGASGWSYDEVLPYFKKSEQYAEGGSEYHGTGGLLNVCDCPDPVMRSEEFLGAATELGFDGPRWDYNGSRQENGAGFLQFHIDPHGQRASGATAFLDPVKDRPNLTITTQAEVTRLLLEANRVVGVEFVHQGQVQQVKVEREVVLSAGALLSPKILMLSGIGAADPLQSFGIPVVVDLPGVGQNLKDHVQLPVVYRRKTDHPMTTLLSGNVLFLNTLDPDLAPNLQLNFTPSAPRPLAPFLPDFGGPVCIFLPILVRPESTGSVTLRSSRPEDPPCIHPHYLEHPADLQVFVEALALIRRLAKTQAFQDLNQMELAPGEGDFEGYVRSQSSTLWHPVGTCKIGQDPMAVVNSHLQVHGVEGLRIADASVMPTITSGNTVAACFMIGEKAADLMMA